MGNNDEDNNKWQSNNEKGASNKAAITIIIIIIVTVLAIVLLSIDLASNAISKNKVNSNIKAYDTDIAEEKGIIPKIIDKEVFYDIIDEKNTLIEEEIKTLEQSENKENNIFISKIDLGKYRTELSEEKVLYPFYNEEYMCGYMDENGEVCIEPIYDYGAKFNEGYAYVFNENESGYINLNGEMILDIDNYCFGYEFINGLAVLQHIDPETGDTDKYIVINENGDEILSGEYDYILVDNAGFIECSVDGRCIYFDLDGNELKAMANFYIVKGFINGYAVIEDTEIREYYLVDSEYNTVEIEGYELTDYFNGLIEFYNVDNDEYLYLNEELKIIELREDIYRLWYYNYGDEIAYGISIDNSYNESYIYIDNMGNELFTSEYEIQGPFIDGIASVYYYDESYNFYEGIMDVRGNLIEIEEEIIEVLNNKSIIVSNEEDLWGVKDIELGKITIEQKYYFIEIINNTIICSLYNEDEDIWGYEIYSFNGEVLIEGIVDDYFSIDSKIINCINYLENDYESYYFNTETCEKIN